MAVSISSHYRSILAVFEESTIGQPPGFTVSVPQGTQSGWSAADVADTAIRMRHIEAPVDWLKINKIEDESALDGVFAKNVMLDGLPSLEGGTIVLPLGGSDQTTADATQIADSSLARMLKNALGGHSRTNETVITSGADANTFDVTSTTNISDGDLVFASDTGDANKLWPVFIDSISTLTIDSRIDLPFTPANADILHAAHVFYPDPANLVPTGAGYTTLSLLYAKGGDTWEATGAHLEFVGITWERGAQAKMTFNVMASDGYLPDDAPDEPSSWTQSVEGSSGEAAGLNTYVRITNTGTSASVCVDAQGLDFKAGVPCTPMDVATSCTGVGRYGYSTAPGDTTLDLQVFMDTDYFDGMQANTTYRVELFQVGVEGQAWCVVLPEARITKTDYAEGNGVNMLSLSFMGYEQSSGTDAKTKAKFLFAVG